MLQNELEILEITKILQKIGETISQMEREINLWKYEREKVQQTNYQTYKFMEEIKDRIQKFEANHGE
jgi:hypothetical protein